MLQFPASTCYSSLLAHVTVPSYNIIRVWTVANSLCTINPRLNQSYWKLLFYILHLLKNDPWEQKPFFKLNVYVVSVWGLAVHWFHGIYIGGLIYISTKCWKVLHKQCHIHSYVWLYQPWSFESYKFLYRRVTPVILSQLLCHLSELLHSFLMQVWNKALFTNFAT